MSYWYGQASAIRRSYQAAAAAQCLPTDGYNQPKRLRNSQVMQFPCRHLFELSSQLFSYQSDMASQQKRSVGGYSSFACFCTCWGPADSRLSICEAQHPEQNRNFPACHLLVQELGCVFSKHRGHSFQPYRVQQLVADQGSIRWSRTGFEPITVQCGRHSYRRRHVERTTV